MARFADADTACTVAGRCGDTAMAGVSVNRHVRRARRSRRRTRHGERELVGLGDRARLSNQTSHELSLSSSSLLILIVVLGPCC